MKQILVGTDGSKRVERAISFAADLAAWQCARISTASDLNRTELSK